MSSRENRNFAVVDITTEGRYPRDLKGYSGNPPDPKWPNGAHVAINFVLNFECGAEKNVLHGDGISEQVGQEAFFGQYEDERCYTAESTLEYGPRAGMWRFMKIFDDRGLKFTAWAVAMALERNPEITKYMFENGHELGCHGYRWYDYYGVPEHVEKQHIQKCVDVTKKLTGTRPTGIGMVRRSPNTLKLAVEEGGFEYYSDAWNDDLPYYDYSLGSPNLIVPYSIALNDAKFWRGDLSTGEDFYKNLKDYLDCLWEEGAKGSPKMMTVAMHDRTIGLPNRAIWLARFLDYAQSKGKVWIARRDEIATHFRKVHPPESLQHYSKSKL